MHFQSGAITVTLNGAGVASSAIKADGANVERHETSTGKTVAVYESAPVRSLHSLDCKLVDAAKNTELLNFWALVGGAKTSFTYRDRHDVDHTVIWIDGKYPLTRDGLHFNGTITLEEV